MCVRSLPSGRVTAQIVKKVKSDKPAYLVKMHGDDDHVIEVAYYINKHPKAYQGKEHVYLNAPEVELLGKGPVGEPPVA